MGDSDEPRVGRRKLAVYVLVCFLVGAAGVAGAAHLANSVHVSGGVPIGAPSGLVVTVDGTTQADLADPTTGSDQINVVTEAGNATFTSAGTANATVHKDVVEGAWTNVTSVDADLNAIEINPEDKDEASVAGQTEAFAWRSGIAEDDSAVDFSYSGAAGDSSVTVQGVPSSASLAAVDASNDQIIDTATSSSGGAVTFDELDSGTHDVEIQTFDASVPMLSNPSPTGGTSTAPTQVSVDVTDGDFPRGDSVDVTIDVDGSQVHSETVTSNGTVTASIPSSGQTGGSHTWSVSAEDSYGETASDSYSYSVPTELEIRDEETNELIDGQQVNLTVYTRDPEQITTFNTSDGLVDLEAGFPVSEPFIVVAESDGYLDRRIFVQNVYETQDLYLLNESLAHVETIFQIEDYTGRFPPEDTVLEVQRGINGSWTTVLGDYFGANDQFEAQIRFNTRHRLVLVNAETGERRVLGTYTPLTSAQETISVSPSGDLGLPDEHPTVSFSPSARTLPDENGVAVSSTISAGTMDLQNWSVSMYHIDPSGTNTTLFSEAGADADGGSKEATLALAGLEGGVKVVTGYTFSNGAKGSQVATYRLAEGTTRSMTLLDGIVGMVALVPGQNASEVLTLTAMILTIVGTAAVGTAFRMSTEGMGAVTVLLVGAFSILGWLPYSLLFTVLVLFGSLMLLRRRY